MTFISIVSSMFDFTYLFYSNSYINNIDKINKFLLKYNILVFIVAILYIILGIRAKKEVILKVSFSIFSILTLIENVIAELFGMFG